MTWQIFAPKVIMEWIAGLVLIVAFVLSSIWFHRDTTPPPDPVVVHTPPPPPHAPSPPPPNGCGVGSTGNAAIDDFMHSIEC